MTDSSSSILKTFSDKEFIKLEGLYSKRLASFGLNINRSRFKKSFDVYSKVTEELESNDSKVVPEKYIRDFRYATYDLSQLLDIYNALQNHPDKNLVKEKLKKLNKGSSIPSEESSANTVSRDTQFELKLFSDLRESGVRCDIKEPRPDIEFVGADHKYAIECKRVFSDKDSKVSTRVAEARDQLKMYLEENKNGIGIIAIDITRRLTGGNTYLRAKNEQVATSRLSHELDEFRKKFARYWSPNRLEDQRIVAVLLYASMYSYLEERELASHASQIVVQNTFSTPYSNILFRNAINEVFGPLSIYKTGELKVHSD
jgi:hypothetical protein